MKSSIFKVALVGVLAFATTFAIAQATAPDQSTSPSTGAQTGTTTPDQSASPSSQYPSSSGSQTGATGQSSSGTSASSASSTSDVQTKIQSAFQQDPTLANSGIQVSVSDDKVELSGSAKSSDEKDKAKSIAESNAGGRQVVDNVKVGSGSESSMPPSAPPQ